MERLVSAKVSLHSLHHFQTVALTLTAIVSSVLSQRCSLS